MRRSATIAQMTEAVALASVVGADRAASDLGWDPRTVRKWQAKAGHRPELDGDSDQLQALADLALARVTSDVAGGKIRGTALMTVFGIARDKLDRARREATRAAQSDETPDDREPLTTAARDRFEAWVATLEPPQQRAIAHVIRAELLRRAEAAGDRGIEPLSDADGAEIWRSVQAQLLADLPVLVDRMVAEEALEADRQRVREGLTRWLSDEDADLLIAAEKYLEEIA